jgi:hypothetical protein
VGSLSFVYKRWLRPHNDTLSPTVGVRLPEALELQRERKKENERERESGTKSKANSCSKKPLPLGGVHAGLFIEEVKGLITMP